MKTIINKAAIIFIGLLTTTAMAAEGAPVGKDLYELYCVQCHGTKRDGNGINAASMSVQPRSHIDRQEMSQRSDEELFKVIAEGGPAINKSVLMPAWKGNVSETEIEALVEYLRQLCCS